MASAFYQNYDIFESFFIVTRGWVSSDKEVTSHLIKVREYNNVEYHLLLLLKTIQSSVLSAKFISRILKPLSFFLRCNLFVLWLLSWIVYVRQAKLKQKNCARQCNAKPSDREARYCYGDRQGVVSEFIWSNSDGARRR